MSRDAVPVLLMRKNRKVRNALDITIYTLRNMAEPCLSRFKNNRRMATYQNKVGAASSAAST